jgi:hypothetical protein
MRSADFKALSKDELDRVVDQVIDGAEAESNTHARQELVTRESLQVLSSLMEFETAKFAATEQLRASTVLVWGAFETLATDVFVFLLNEKPELSRNIFENEQTKKLYERKLLAIALETYQYDLSRHLGEALLDQKRLDKLEPFAPSTARYSQTREICDVNCAQLSYGNSTKSGT